MGGVQTREQMALLNADTCHIVELMEKVASALTSLRVFLIHGCQAYCIVGSSICFRGLVGNGFLPGHLSKYFSNCSGKLGGALEGFSLGVDPALEQASGRLYKK